VIRLDRVELLHWDIQPHQMLPLARGVTMLTGENGSGKTSILDALKVGLGARSLGGERTVDQYLLKQAQPVAMVRLLVDNRPEPGGRRRPFDALGEQSEDVVTLAVVFEQEDEHHYTRAYYILDGDVVPPPLGAPVPGRTRRDAPRKLGGRDYRERLARVGIGEQYLKLLCLPQGDIATLCQSDGARLFDKLFDVIGGRQTLETWEERLRELSDKQREHAAVDHELAASRKDLELLRQRVLRHEEWRDLHGRVQDLARAIPHQHVVDARARVDQLGDDISRATADRDAADARLRDAERRAEHLRGALATLEDRLVRHREDRQALRDTLKATHADLGRHRVELLRLEALREAAAGVEPRDPSRLEAERDELRASLAAGDADARARSRARAAHRAELDQVERGLTPFPPEVDAFRETLRRAGVAHHVLAEVLEVEDEAWADAVEGVLGRLRLAILVQDPDRWAEAAALARRERFTHGVLAPDVRGSSPRDERGLNALVRVGETRYRSLVARVLRGIRPEEPPTPLEAPRGGIQFLADDGFHVSRLEARHAPAERLFLGRRARERRRAQLTAALAELDAADASWAREAAELRRAIVVLEADLEAQRRRLAWEAEQGRFAEVAEAVARLEEQLARHDERQRALDDERDRLDAERANLSTAKGAVETEITQATAARAAAERAISAQDEARERARAEFGDALGGVSGELDDRVRAVLAEGHSLQTLRTLREREEERLDAFEPAVRDTLLPTNYARQVDELEAVTAQLERLKAAVDRTREAAEDAHAQYVQTTRRVFRAYFGQLRAAAERLDWAVEGRLEDRADKRFACDIRVAVSDKTAVRHDSEELSGGQKAALSILMGMTAVSLESEGAGFFLIDEPFSASDVTKINDLGRFLAETGAQYLLSMPTSDDLRACGPWLSTVWLCTRSRGGVEADGGVRLAPPVEFLLTKSARERPADD